MRPLASRFDLTVAVLLSCLVAGYAPASAQRSATKHTGVDTTFALERHGNQRARSTRTWV